jgi:hypothetical protein
MIGEVTSAELFMFPRIAPVILAYLIESGLCNGTDRVQLYYYYAVPRGRLCFSIDELISDFSWAAQVQQDSFRQSQKIYWFPLSRITKVPKNT